MHRRADAVIRIGIGVTLTGLVFTLVALLPLVVPGIAMPGALWFLSMLTGVGLAIVLVGLAMQSRSRRQ